MNPCPKPVKPILLTGKKYTEFRREVAKRAGERCEAVNSGGKRCNSHAPVLIYGVFDVFNCGHVAHIVRRRKGGDVLSNVKWKCYHHHIEIEHGPQWGNLERINER